MKKHCLYLPERQVASLKEIAKREELSVSELVRRYLDEKIKDDEKIHTATGWPHPMTVSCTGSGTIDCQECVECGLVGKETCPTHSAIELTKECK